MFNSLFRMMAAGNISDSDYNWIDAGRTGGGSGVFGNLITTAEDTAKSGYGLAFKLGMGILVISIIAVGIGFVVNSSGSKTEQNKEWLMRIVVGGVLIAGALTVTGIIVKMANGLG